MSSTPSRVALAPLNTNVSMDSPAVKLRLFHGSSMALAPLLTPKFAMAKSATSIVPSRTSYTSARKFDSFSDYRISNNRNVKADLAATKLKLRLQLAFYKLKVQKKASHATSPNIRVLGQFRVAKAGRPNINGHSAKSKADLRADFNASNASNASLNTNSNANPDADCHSTNVSNANYSFNSNPSVKSQTPNGDFSNGANVNLQKPRLVSNPRLSVVASKKSTLKLYHIKALSAFHNATSTRLPLSSSATQHPANASLADILMASSHGLASSVAQQRLPPLHKILKTPIKGASKPPASTSDETIDETADESTLEVKKRDDILGSLPLRHNFGTPNSFSVAKSLLQLGLGFY